MTTIKFYDTSSLLLKVNTLFDEKEKFVISSITLEELEKIKNSTNKDADIKYASRKLINMLDNHMGEYEIITYTERMKSNVLTHLKFNNDIYILACAIEY